MQKLIIEIAINSKEIESVKNALLASKKDTKLIFKTKDGQYYEINGIIKKTTRP